jgi:trehalose 6-phosphate synthase
MSLEIEANRDARRGSVDSRRRQALRRLPFFAADLGGEEGVYPMWTRESLHDLIQNNLREHDLIVVANREPYLHRHVSGRIDCVPPASGMVSALDPILRACGGVWVAHGSGSADRRTVDELDHIRVPPDDPSYTLRRVWLSKEQEDNYY